MRADRGIHLDISARRAGRDAYEGDAGMQGRQEEPDAQTREAFEQALAGKREQPKGKEDQSQIEANGPTQDGSVDAASHLAGTFSSPFDLLAASRAPVAAPAAPAIGHAGTIAQVLARVREGVQQLMVQADSHGPRQVRMVLGNDTLPGVTVHLQERGGRLAVEFSCEARAEFDMLSRQIEVIASKLAKRLQRDVLVCVQSTQGQDEPVEMLGTANTERK